MVEVVVLMLMLLPPRRDGVDVEYLFSCPGR